MARFLSCGLAFTVAFLAGCGGSRESTLVPPPVPDELRPFLESPTVGFPQALSDFATREIETAYRGLLSTGDSSAARRVAGVLLQRDPDLAPALVLAAQADLVDGAAVAARRQMEPVVSRYPDYPPAQLVLARSAELSDEIVLAFQQYWSLADRRVVAERRARELRSRALEIQGERVRDAIARGRLEDSRREIDLLFAWDEDSEATLELAFEVARLEDDFERQLELAQTLAERAPEEIDRQVRWGELEVRGGDPMRALEIFENLIANFPEDPFYAEQRDRAMFVWRLRNLPPKVAETVAKPELTRADYAVLLYWLVPGVRAGSTAQPRIATDILDHPRRQEIIRIVNLELMELDGSLRTFRPDESVQRVEGLRALLRAMRRYQPVPACIADSPRSLVSWDTVCRLSAACGVLPSPLDCLPSAPLTGREALEWVRRGAAF